MFCPTPSIDIDKFKRTSRRRGSILSGLNYDIPTDERTRRESNDTSLNEKLDIDVEISFILDGVPDYRNLTGTSLEEYSQLNLYYDPMFVRFGTSGTLTFTPTWPVEDKYLEIKVNKKVFMKHGMF